MKLVFSSGPEPNICMFVGEAPGQVEYEQGKPFVGPSGQAHAKYLSRCGLNVNDYYLTNLVKEYQEGNPDPTPEQIAEWFPLLLQEIHDVSPKLIVAVGRYAAQALIGDPSLNISLIHGIPHKSLLPSIPSNILILPITHPAAGLWNYETRAHILEDYKQVASCLYKLEHNLPISYRHDPYAGKESYLDCTGSQLSSILKSHKFTGNNPIIGLDTEGIPSKPWSVQLSLSPGTGLVLRCSQPDFSLGILSIQSFLHTHSPVVCMHQASTPSCACYDVVMCRAMGLELQSSFWFDTMYNAYLYRLESQALKVLSYRHCGIEGEDYESIIGDIGRAKQIAYLEQVLSLDWPKPQSRIVHKNDGTKKPYTPQAIPIFVTSILRDIASNKLNKDNEPTDPYSRWEGKGTNKGIDKSLKHIVESTLGPMPTGTLDDIPLDKAIFYAGGDPDKTLRLALSFMARNDSRISSLMSDGMQFLPIVERMQANGMLASRSHFESLSIEMQEIVDRIGHRLSQEYFNPLSRPQVTSLCLRRGLSPRKRTKLGAISTSEKSLGEYVGKDPAITLLFDWRKAHHNKTTYCNDVLDRIPESEDLYLIHSNLKPTTVHTRRLSAENPNILGVPTRTPLGRKVRHGYKSPPGKIFLSIDLSGIEMRCMAHLSRDPLLCKVFRDGIHPHRDTARLLFKLPSINSVTDTQKAVGKETNFLTIYGGAYKRLYEELRSKGVEGYDLDACRKLLIDYFQIYSGVKAYSLRTAHECHKSEIVYDHWGMARYLPGINCGDREIEAEEERAAVSQKVQGLAQGMIQKSIIWLDPIIQDYNASISNPIDSIDWRLLVHDELMFTCPDKEDVKEMLNHLAMQALTKHCGIELIVPVEAESHWGYTWGEAK
jgi:uracil-DNA glycosylase family 4